MNANVPGLIFATTNVGKLREVRQILGRSLEVSGLPPGLKEPVEDGVTFLENACIKARHYFELVGVEVLAEDSGLVVDALDGQPGIHSARFGGKTLDDQQRNALLLENMKYEKNRSARFEAVLVYCDNFGKLHDFSGTLEGSISQKPTGQGGFGYDPVFLPEGRKQTTATLSVNEKNALSHRRKAVQAFLYWYSTH